MNPVILTADDPEPPEGSVVLTQSGDAWQLSNGFWWCRNAYTDTWHDMCANSPLTLIHRGPDPDPEPPTTWRHGDPMPPVGTVVSQRYGWALTCFGDDWGSTNQPFPPDDPDPVYTVLRWGWTK